MTLKHRALRAFGLVVCAALGTARAWAAPAPIPPSPERFLTDRAGLLSPGTREMLDRRLQAYEQRTGRQFLVYIDQTTGDSPIEDFAVAAFKAWKVGRKGLDDGLALFVMAQDRRIRFEVGYGLEPVFPDALASRVLNDVLAPRLRSGDADGALTAAVDAVLTAVEGPSAGEGQDRGPLVERRARGPRPPSLAQKVLFGLIALAFIALFISNPNLAIYLLFNILSSGGRMGGGRDDRGGGFSGGGGRSGGGGATGSW